MNRASLHHALLQLFAEGGGAPADRWRLLTACLFGAALPLAPHVLPLLLAVMVAAQVLRRAAWRRPLLRVDRWAPSPWLLLYFLAHVAGMAWTANQGFGWFDIGIKLALLVLPALACLRGAEGRGRDAVLISFALGCAVAVLFYLAWAIARWLQPGSAGLEEFISSRFAQQLHPSYLAWYLVSAIAMLLAGPAGGRFPGPWRLLVVLVLTTGVVLCQGRMGWIALPMVLLWSLAQGWRTRALRFQLLGLLFAAVLGGALLAALSPGVRARLADMAQAVTEERAEATQSAAIRTVTWRAAWSVGLAHLPLGTGTGDVKDELLREYGRVGAAPALEKRLNAHNQFLQSFAALGLPGALLLLLALVLPLLRPGGAREERGMRRLLLLVAILNLAVESMLEVQAGVLFMAFVAWVAWWPGEGAASSRA